MRKLPSIVWLLSSGLFFVGAGQAVVFITIPPLARDLGLSEIQTGIIFASSALAWMIFSPYWGKLSDRIGRKVIVVVGLLGCACSLILFSSALTLGTSQILLGWKLLAILILARMINGILGSATRPGAGAWVADVTNLEERGAGYGRLNSGFSAGRIVGPAIAGFLLVISYTLPFYIFSIGLGVVALLLIRQPSIKNKDKNDQKPGDLRLSDSRVWPFLLVGACLGVCNAALVQTSSFYFQDVIVPKSSNAIALASLGFMLTAFGSILGQLILADRLRVSPGSLIRYGTLLCVVSLFCIALSNSLNSIYISLFLFGLGQGTQSTGLAASISLSVGPENQGKANGFMGMVLPIGHIISPIIAMPLYMNSPEYPYILGGITMFGALIFIQINSRHKWIRKKGYKKINIERNQSIEES
ncbi:MAG: MFS transporter [Gammaproteobacteria bacterium]